MELVSKVGGRWGRENPTLPTATPIALPPQTKPTSNSKVVPNNDGDSCETGSLLPLFKEVVSQQYCNEAAKSSSDDGDIGGDGSLLPLFNGVENQDYSNAEIEEIVRNDKSKKRYKITTIKTKKDKKLHPKLTSKGKVREVKGKPINQTKLDSFFKPLGNKSEFPRVQTVERRPQKPNLDVIKESV